MKFNERQLEAINSKQGMYAVLAKAGSGKTAVLVERINQLIEEGANPKKIMVITFSNEAKENLLARVKYKDVCIKTFHGLAYGIVRLFHKDIKLWEQIWEKEKCITESVKSLGYKTKDIDFFNIYKFISFQRFNLLEPKDSVSTEDMPYDLTDMKEIYADYINHKKRNNLIEFDDMVYQAIDDLKENPETLERLQCLVEYCMVDEFQDTSTDQIELLKMLTAKNKNLMVVGDPTQNIYAFRGSNAKYLTYFDEHFPGGKFINMNINYRSSQSIVGYSNVIARQDTSTNSDNYEEAVTPNETGVLPCLKTQRDICKYIKEYQALDYEYKDMFILTRTNSELQDFEARLSMNEIPYKTYNNKSFLDSPEIKLVLSYLLLADDLEDNDSFVYLVNRPSRFISKDTLNSIKEKSLYEGILNLAKDNWKFQKAANDLSRVIGGLRRGHFDNVGEMIEFLRDRVDIDGFVKKDQTDTDNRIENIDRFQETCKGFVSMEQLRLFMSKIRSNNKKDDKNRIHLLTAHKSKGMESKVVFVAGMNEGTFPHKNATDIESELRLYYVACTRAEEHLILLYDETDKPSSFLISSGLVKTT